MLPLTLEREEGRERNIDVRETDGSVAPLRAPTWDRTHNLGMCLHLESNREHLSAQNHAPTTWATWPGCNVYVFKYK